jgi:hypothetical protein
VKPNLLLNCVVELPAVARRCGSQAKYAEVGVDQGGSTDADVYHGTDLAETRIVLHVVGQKAIRGFLVEETLCGRNTADLPNAGQWGKLGTEDGMFRCPRCLELAPLKPRRSRRAVRWPRPRREEPAWWSYPPAPTKLDYVGAVVLSCASFIPPMIIPWIWQFRLSTYFGPDGVTVNRWHGQDKVPWHEVQRFGAMARRSTVKIIVVTTSGASFALTSLPPLGSRLPMESALLSAGKLNAAFGFSQSEEQAPQL